MLAPRKPQKQPGGIRVCDSKLEKQWRATSWKYNSTLLTQRYVTHCLKTSGSQILQFIFNCCVSEAFKSIVWFLHWHTHKHTQAHTLRGWVGGVTHCCVKQISLTEQRIGPWITGTHVQWSRNKLRDNKESPQQTNKQKTDIQFDEWHLTMSNNVDVQYLKKIKEKKYVLYLQLWKISSSHSHNTGLKTKIWWMSNSSTNVNLNAA